MARILLDNEWFEQVAPGALYESEFEDVVLQQSHLLFPEYHLLPFRTLVYSDEDGAIPDMALIEKNYREWWVVEVEKSDHSLDGHVLPQVRTLSRAKYSSSEAQILLQQMRSLDQKRLQDMVKGKPPRVLVIVDSLKPDWVMPLRALDALLAVVEIFRSDRNRRIFRINGERPVPFAEAISECALDPIVPGFLVISSPSVLGERAQGKIRIKYNDYITEWERIDTSDKVWLAPIGGNPLKDRSRYELIQHANGSLELRPKTRARA